MTLLLPELGGRKARRSPEVSAEPANLAVTDQQRNLLDAFFGANQHRFSPLNSQPPNILRERQAGMPLQQVNELTSVTDPMNRTVNYAYDASGNLITISKPLNLTVANTFNPQGQLVSSTPGGTGGVTVSYAGGGVSSVSNATQATISSTADGIGRTTALLIR